MNLDKFENEFPTRGKQGVVRGLFSLAAPCRFWHCNRVGVNRYRNDHRRYTRCSRGRGAGSNGDDTQCRDWRCHDDEDKQRWKL
jgi:hypothetical protein